MDWVVIKSNSREKRNFFVIECKSVAQANGAIEEGLAIGAELHRCTLYNPACKQKQCFNCQQYSHLAIHCTNTQACGFCAAAHRTQDCKKDTPKKCIFCKGAYKTWDHRCEFKKKELERIKRAKEETTPRYEIRLTPSSAQASLLLPWSCNAVTIRVTWLHPSSNLQTFRFLYQSLLLISYCWRSAFLHRIVESHQPWSYFVGIRFSPFVSLSVSYRNVVWVKSETSSDVAWAYPASEQMTRYSVTEDLGIVGTDLKAWWLGPMPRPDG